MEGLLAVQARIRAITSQFPTARTSGGRFGEHATADPANTDFAALLSQMQGGAATGATGAGIPAAGGTYATGHLNKAGVDPGQWAHDFLTKLGMPVTTENMRAMKAWQQAEGTAARFNPLATTQGGFAGATNFNSVGVKNYTNYADGLAANVKVIQNGKYPNVLAALRSGNDAMAVARAIKQSPWGTGGLVETILARG